MFKTKTSDEKDLKKLYNGSALTIEGLSSDSFQDWYDYLKNKGFVKNEDLTIYVTTGYLMNTYYNLSGSNQYPDDLTIVSIDREDLDNIGQLAIDRFSYGFFNCYVVSHPQFKPTFG